MGLRVQRRIRIAKGVYLNVSKTGVGISSGVPGLRVGVNSRGQSYSSVGIPGTGIRYASTSHAPRTQWIPHGPEGHQIPMAETPHVHWFGGLVLVAIFCMLLSTLYR